MPSLLESHELCITNVKRPDSFITIPWKKDEQLVCMATVVDAHAPSRLKEGSLFNPELTYEESQNLGSIMDWLTTDTSSSRWH